MPSLWLSRDKSRTKSEKLNHSEYIHVDPSWLLAQPEALNGFEMNALQFMMIKDLAHDVIVWCNAVAATSLGARPEDMAGKPSKDFYPDTYNLFRQDDLEIARRGDRLEYLESFTGIGGEVHQLLTSKWCRVIAGKQYIFIAAIDMTKAVNIARSANAPRGSSFDFSALDDSVRRFDDLLASL